MNIYEKKYQIFVSSTYTDLIKAREEVIKVILSLYQIPIGMEMFSADNDEQWSIIKSTIENSDYYLLIIGHRYGSLTKEDISYTEKEFDYAKSLNIPIIAFVKNRDIATKPNERDKEQIKTILLENFLNKVLKNSMCDFWENENELGQKVAIALTKLFFKTPRIGWVKSNNLNSAETTEELTKLIQENRELREELLKINAVFTNEIPKIEVQLNKNNLNLNFKKERFIEFRSVKYSELSELQEFVTEVDTQNYNREIENKKNEIEIYKTEFEKIENIKKNHTELIIEISNTGYSKANDIFIDIKFPKEIFIGEKDDFDEIEKPIKPDLPENPINKGLRLKNKKLSTITSFGDVISSISYPQISTKILRAINVNRNFWIDKENNLVTIKIPKLTQTRTLTIKDDIIIAPLKKGIYEIIINIICDEFKESKIQILEITIE